MRRRWFEGSTLSHDLLLNLNCFDNRDMVFLTQSWSAEVYSEYERKHLIRLPSVVGYRLQPPSNKFGLFWSSPSLKRGIAFKENVTATP